MFAVLSFLLAFIWVIAFGVRHVEGSAIHALLVLAAASLLLHFIHIRKYRAPAKTLPPDAIK